MTISTRSRTSLPSTKRHSVASVCALLTLVSVIGCSSEPAGSGSLGGASPLAGSGGAAGAGRGGTAGSGGSAESGGASAGGTREEGGGGASAGSGGSTRGGAAGSGGGPSAGSDGGPSVPAVHYVGRVDTSDPNTARFAWSGTGAIVRFTGSAASVELRGGQEYSVVIDGTVQPKLVATDGKNTLAQGLSPGEHIVELYRRTEASQGESEIRGFDFGGGQLLAPNRAVRRLEFIGDSITCGYGNEGASASCGFTPQTENHYLSYAAITARNLQAELSTVAWSGKGVVCNYGDDANSCTDPLPTYYDRILPNRADSVWDFSRFQPDAVVINLGTNDLSTNTDPDQATFESGYKAFLVRVRHAYPTARILCTNGPMLSGTDLSNVRRYIGDVVKDLADPNVSTFEIPTQDGSDGYGCDSHPSLERHKKMATVVTAALKAALGW